MTSAKLIEEQPKPTYNNKFTVEVDLSGLGEGDITQLVKDMEKLRDEMFWNGWFTDIMKIIKNK